MLSLVRHPLRTLVTLACATLTSFAAHAQTLVAEYRMDEAQWSGSGGEVIDSAAFGNHGRAINGASTAGGRVCRGGWFRGEGYNAPPNNAWYVARHYVEIPDHDSLSPLDQSNSSAMTISGWIRPDSVSGTHTVLHKGEGGNSQEYRLHLEGGRLHFTVWNRDGSERVQQLNHTLTAGQWYFFAATGRRRGASGNVAFEIQLYGTGGDSPLATASSGNVSFDLTNKNTSGRLFIGATSWGATPTNFFDGMIDELRIHGHTQNQDIGVVALKNTTRPCANQPICVADAFERSELGDDWSVTNRSGSFGNPRIVDGRLRLTNTSGNVATAATFQRLFPSSSNRVTLEFDYYAYGGNGADGIAVVLSDAATTPAPGAYGGSLGYANGHGIEGFSGGWLGMGLDSYGNYSNPTEGRSGGPGRRQNAVALRGSGAGQSGYAYISGTATLSPTVRNSTGHRYRVTVDSQVAGQSWVTIERDTGSGFQTLIGPLDVLSSAGQATVPANLLLTLTGSTGGSNDNHEIDNLEVCALRMEPLEPQVHHFRILHDGAGLTCAPETVTIQACASNDCSSLYAGNVDIALLPANTSGQYWLGGSNLKSFSGGSGAFQLRRNTSGTVALGITSGTPAAANVTRCFRNGVEGNCSLSFAASGLVFDVPTLIAGKPADVVVSARRSDPANPETCAPAMTGPRTIGFRSTYDDPGSGSARVHVDGSAVSNGAAWTNLPLLFDGNADATISVRYDDAGLMSLHARYQGTATDEDSGLQLTGSDGFVVKPAGLCVTSPAPGAACPAADHSCSAFVAAGAGFDLVVRAVAWESDADSDLCTGNATTPNYRQSGITLGATLVAPGAGSPGGVGAASTSFAASEAGARTLTQSISEVGVFRFTATPPVGAYFGETVAGGESVPIGRFIPARLAVAPNTPLFDHACSAGSFSYLGQPFGFLVDPQITVTGLNTAGGVTRNYGGPFWRLASSLAERNHVEAAGTAASLQVDAAGSVSWSGTGDYDGAGRATLTGVQMRYGKPNNPQAPFGARVHLDLSAADLTDADGACHDPDTNGSCDGFRLADIGGTQLRWGRLVVERRHQHLETADVALPVRAEQFDGSRFVLNADDSCTALGAAALLRLDNNLQTAQSGGIAIGSGSTSLGGFGTLSAGLLDLSLSAPGLGNAGFVDVSALLGAADLSWLGYDWNGDGAHDNNPRGRASWGLYRGNPAVIRMREVWR